MKRLEKAVKGELEGWGDGVACSALAETALLLARRLEGNPGDREAATLARELRLVMAELRGLVGSVPSELEGFLAGIAASSLR